MREEWKGQRTLSATLIAVADEDDGLAREGLETGVLFVEDAGWGCHFCEGTLLVGL